MNEMISVVADDFSWIESQDKGNCLASFDNR